MSEVVLTEPDSMGTWVGVVTRVARCRWVGTIGIDSVYAGELTLTLPVSRSRRSAVRLLRRTFHYYRNGISQQEDKR